MVDEKPNKINDEIDEKFAESETKKSSEPEEPIMAEPMNKPGNVITNFINDWKSWGTAKQLLSIVCVCCIGIILFAMIFGGGTPDANTSQANDSSDSNSVKNTSDSNNDNSANDKDSSTEDTFSKDKCKEIDFKQLNKNPDRYFGEPLKFSGRVMQIQEDNYGGVILLYVDDNTDQLIYISYDTPTDIVEDDYITVYGEGFGTMTYETRIGENTVPWISAEAFE